MTHDLFGTDETVLSVLILKLRVKRQSEHGHEVVDETV